jgi:hypothetical protein
MESDPSAMCDGVAQENLEDCRWGFGRRGFCRVGLPVSRSGGRQRRIRDRSLFMAGVVPKRKGLGKQNFK